MLHTTVAEKANRLRHIFTGLTEAPLPAAEYERGKHLIFALESVRSEWLSDDTAAVTQAIIDLLTTALNVETRRLLAGDREFSQGRLFLILTARLGEKATLAAQLNTEITKFKRALVAE